MGEIIIDNKFNAHEKYNKVNIINSYRFKKGGVNLNLTLIEQIDVYIDYPSFGAPRGIAISPDGKNIAIVSYAGQEATMTYTLLNSDDFSSYTTAVHAKWNIQPWMIAFSVDGLKMINGQINNNLYARDLTIPFYPTPTANQVITSLTSVGTEGRGLFYFDGGLTLYVGRVGLGVQRYTLTIPYDTTTMTLSQTYSLVAPSFVFINSGTQILVADNTNFVHLHDLGTPYDLSTVSVILSSFDLGELPFEITMSDNQNFLYAQMNNSTAETIKKYQISIT